MYLVGHHFERGLIKDCRVLLPTCNEVGVTLYNFLVLRRVILYIVCLGVISPTMTFANSKLSNKLSIPRFASIKSNEVNARKGPTIKSSIEWVFMRKGEPIKITAEYDQWRQIQDVTGEGGWVHSSLLSGKRSVIIIENGMTEITKSPNPNSKIVAKICSKVRCSLNKCNGNYCQIRCKNKTGWVNKKALWGV